MAVDWDALVIGPTVGVFGEGTPQNPKPIRYLTPTGVIWIDGVFDEAYLELTPLGRGGIDSESFSLGSPGAVTTEMPVLGVQLSQFTTPPAQGDTLIVRGTAYSVKEVRPDGHGGAKLLLNQTYG